ncbi:hypothetical protein KAR91_08575 [Candidatus Pacearchaeota archaeon]|nr:hypothetical protein [Candidatus Pacearchaeota archaeon]
MRECKKCGAEISFGECVFCKLKTRLRPLPHKMVLVAVPTTSWMEKRFVGTEE